MELNYLIIWSYCLVLRLVNTHTHTYIHTHTHTHTHIATKKDATILKVPDTHEGVIITPTFLWIFWWLMKN